MLEIKNTVTEIKNAFDGPISRLDMSKERISDYENMAISTYKTDWKEKKE